MLERALAFAPTGLVVVGLDGRVRWANRELATMLGETEVALLGRDIDEFVHPPNERVVPREFAPAGRTFDRSRRRVRRADGTLLWVRMMFTRLGSEDGWVAHIADITETIRAEERLGLVVEGIDDGVVVVDPTGRVVSVNPAGSRLLGVDGQPMIGRRLTSWAMVDEAGNPVADEDRPESVAMATGAASHLVLGIVHRDDTRWVRVAAQPLQRTDTERWVVASYKDVTDRRRALDAIEADRAKSEFLSRMSHELRTPLNSVLGFAQLLLAEAMPDRQREAVDQILTAGKHLLGLVDEVLDLARIESDHLDLLLEPIAIDHALREAVELVGPLAAARDVEIELAQDASRLVCVRADRRRLRQVLLNLLTNAIKYNRHGGGVTAWSSGDDDSVTVSVTDTGRGIAPERMVDLFVPFERLGAEHLGVEGVGVGLALSKRLVEAMNGSIDVDSAPEIGSTFSITLPTCVPDAEAPATGEVGGPGLSFRSRAATTRRVLYIEDNDANRMLLERVASRDERVELITVGLASEGLALARRIRPEIVLLDLNLPDQAGEDVLRALRTDPTTSDISVVIVSADATPSRIDQLLAAGASGYLTKPIDVTELFAVIDSSVVLNP